ncbi:MAG TPA: response regulator transcription factor [Verrucomicrobiae bacterium]|nr:response regulator transcription factor [Verrucomicrobiae bacterium]
MTITSAQTSIWLVEDNSAYRRTVGRLIDRLPGFRCAQLFANCEDALAAMTGTSEVPEIILLDVGLPGMSGLEGIRHFKEHAPGIHVIILTVFDDREKIFNAICAGASGYLLKTATEERIGEALREVLNGGAPMTASIAQKVLERFSQLAVPRGEYGLTSREREILELMVEGLIKKEIADRISLSYHTVDTHLRNIYSKLQVHNRSEAVGKAVKERLV